MDILVFQPYVVPNLQSYGAQLRANLDPTKGVGRLRQQDGGHGSRNPLRSV